MTPILPIDSSFAPSGFTPVVVPAKQATSSGALPEQSGHIFQPLPARAGTESHRAQLDALLDLCVERRASDVHLTGGVLPYFRIDSALVPIGDRALSAHDVEQMAESLMTDHQHRVFEEKQSLDLAFFTPGKTRYRVNIFRQRGSVAMALRRLDDDFKTLVQLNLPPQLGSSAIFLTAWCSSPAPPAVASPRRWRPSFTRSTCPAIATSSRSKILSNTSTRTSKASSASGSCFATYRRLLRPCGPPCGKTRT